MAATKTGIKAKNMMYTQQLRHMFTDIQDQQEKLEKLLEIVKKRLKPERYALTVHNQDVSARGDPVELHIHLMRKIGTPTVRYHDLRHPYVKYKTKNFLDF